mmetsp:Transcript_28975/g.81607  ORF Transcript_28975/g.81607 Transcript_28975/m.81607 type:complete len:378 (+) Transcript_28975:1239-2372(+)
MVAHQLPAFWHLQAPAHEVAGGLAPLRVRPVLAEGSLQIHGGRVARRLSAWVGDVAIAVQLLCNLHGLLGRYAKSFGARHQQRHSIEAVGPVLFGMTHIYRHHTGRFPLCSVLYGSNEVAIKGLPLIPLQAKGLRAAAGEWAVRKQPCRGRHGPEVLPLESHDLPHPFHTKVESWRLARAVRDRTGSPLKLRTCQGPVLLCKPAGECHTNLEIQLLPGIHRHGDIGVRSRQLLEGLPDLYGRDGGEAGAVDGGVVLEGCPRHRYDLVRNVLPLVVAVEPQHEVLCPLGLITQMLYHPQLVACLLDDLHSRPVEYPARTLCASLAVAVITELETKNVPNNTGDADAAGLPGLREGRRKLKHRRCPSNASPRPRAGTLG